MSLKTNPFNQIGINQAYPQYSQILLSIKQTNAPNVMSTPFLIFTKPMHQKDMMTPLHVVSVFLMKAVFTQHVTVMSVKKALTQLGVTVPKGQSYGKESLMILLGKELFGKGKLRRKEETKVISKDNLVLVE